MRITNVSNCNLFFSRLADRSYKWRINFCEIHIATLGFERLTFEFMIIRPGCWIISLIKYSSNSAVMLFTDTSSLLNKWNSEFNGNVSSVSDIRSFIDGQLEFFWNNYIGENIVEALSSIKKSVYQLHGWLATKASLFTNWSRITNQKLF